MADTTNKKKLEDYGSFDYADYTESDAVTQQREQLNSWQKPGDFASQYTEAAKQAMDKYLNRDKFSYDLNGDALYQQYKDQYVLQGQMAMQDTIGQASAMTGGYGNSYAQNVGQQAYQSSLQQLNDKVPELYQLALDQYNQEGENLLNQYGLLSDRENTEYGRYRDTVSDAYAERDYLTNQLNAERDFDYSKYSDERNFDYGKFSDERNLDYQLDRDAVSDSQWQEAMDWDKEKEETRKTEWQTEFDERVRQYDQDYNLTVQQIEEDKRHNLITEEQAQQQINLAKEELAQKKKEAEDDLAYKYAALKASQSSSSSNSSSVKPLTAAEWKEVEDNCSAYGDNYNSLRNYINGLVNRKYISEDEAYDLWETYGVKSQGTLSGKPLTSWANKLTNMIN